MGGPEKAAPIPVGVKTEARIAAYAARRAPNAEAAATIIARAIMQDRADRASQEECIREDERDQLYANLAGDGFASAGARASFRANGAMLPADRARLRGDAS